MLVFHLGGDHHVVHVCLDIPPYHGRKYSVHQSLVGRPCILEPEGHHFVAVAGELCHECRLAFVPRMHANLVVPRESIQEAKESTPRGIVYQGVDAGQQVGVLWTGFIKIHEVHTHPPLPAGLLDQLYVRQPL